ncbi:hypothetical protein V8C86DRAFT_2907533 [Haematococcus lacustris]
MAELVGGGLREAGRARPLLAALLGFLAATFWGADAAGPAAAGWFSCCCGSAWCAGCGLGMPGRSSGATGVPAAPSSAQGWVAGCRAAAQRLARDRRSWHRAACACGPAVPWSDPSGITGASSPAFPAVVASLAGVASGAAMEATTVSAARGWLGCTSAMAVRAGQQGLLGAAAAG